MKSSTASIRLALIAVALVTALSAIVFTVASSPETSATAAAAAAPTTDSEPPRGLTLRPGEYRYTVEDLGLEVTTPAGEVIEPARSRPPSSWVLTYRADGSWEERLSGSAAPVRGWSSADEPNEPAARSRADAARNAGSNIPHGGPRIEFNPYGASFIVDIERASNRLANDQGMSVSEEMTSEPCGSSTCTRIVFTREMVEPGANAEYMRSLPWDGENEERAVLIFDPDTHIVHGYEITFDDVVLHRFTLESSPK